MPPEEEYQTIISEIFQTHILTNNGPYVRALEATLKKYLHVPFISYVNNGTTALLLAIKGMGLTGKVITTPFSYVATTSSLVWSGLTPVMVDIDPDTLNIDPHKIEEAIDPSVTGILATHVYGNACAIEQIQSIAKKHNLKVIYDAAHAFGSIYRGKSLFCYGDASVASFHATKVFHTTEGGAVFSDSADFMQHINQLRNFGHTNTNEFHLPGINGKASEFHAAMGLCVLHYVEDILKRREELSHLYDATLAQLPLRRPTITPDCQYNYAYYAVIFESEAILLRAMELLNAHNIFPRRYFNPSLNQLPYVNSFSTPIAEDIASRVLCLPLYYDLEEKDIQRICQVLKQAV